MLFLMLHSNISLKLKNKIRKIKLEKSNIIKLSDIDYFQTSTFNKNIIYLKILLKNVF
jgi:hypothetical protein